MSNETIRATVNGQVQGRAFPDFTQWLGLPYASPPVGPLRWKTPQPPSNWSGIRDATQFAPFSLQEHTEYSHARDGSEDCLYLNVYAPTRLSGPLPVIVWLHGGGFMNGSGNAFMGGILAKEGAIVVTVNYRLGPFGWLALPSLAAEAEDGTTGNYGLLDSIESLQWVKHNIAAFGGDPERVTISGQSAGGEQVLAMLASPYAAGLFQRALSMSAPASLYMPDIQASLARRDQFFADLGTTADAPLHELRAIPAEKLLDAAQESWNLYKSALPWTPVIDGAVLPQQWIKAYQTGHANRVPAMIGHCGDEGRLFKAIFENNKGGHMSAADASESVHKFFAGAADDVVAIYGIEGAADPGSVHAQSFVDGAFAAGQQKLREVLAETMPVYGYQTTDPHAPESHVHAQHSEIGAGHDSDLAHLFGWDDFTSVTPTLTLEQEGFAQALRRYVINFATNGDPNGEGLPRWPDTKAGGVQYIEVDSIGGVRSKSIREYRQEHKLDFWEKFTLV